MRILHSHTIPEDIGQVRFSDYCEAALTHFPSRKSIRKAIKRGALRLDGEVCGTGVWLRPGQVITQVEVPQPSRKVFPMDLKVVFEDDHLAVVHKPAGFVVSGNKYKTIENALPHNLQPCPLPDTLPWPRPVHRLDRGTSGLLLVAKTAKARVDLGRQFEEKEVEKRYRAVVIGEPDAEGVVEQAIDGKPSKTSFKVLRTVPSLRSGQLSLMDLFPHTGRRHQLRIHLAGLGCPILGDKEHGIEGLVLRGKGLFLAAVELGFRHPVSGRALRFEIAQPPKFDHFMEGEERRWNK